VPRPTETYPALHILALWSIAVVQPLLDLLGRSPEFFVAHGAGRTEILLIVFTLIFVLPLPFVLLSWGARVNASFRVWCHGAIVASLAAILTLQVLRVAGLTTWRAAFPLAAATGVLAAVAYSRFCAVRMFLTAGAIAIPVIPLVFLLQPGIRRLLLPPPDALAAVPSPDLARFRPAPVVFVILDETPLVSLLDASGRIDGALYPNIAALARDGRWFRNATAVSDYTQWALPPMVTGLYPRGTALPNIRDYPGNLFVMLGRTHKLKVLEAVTRLCPEPLCKRDPTTLADRLRGMASDIRIVWLHVLLTDDLRSGLPPLTSNWGNFDPTGWRRDRRKKQWERFRRRPDNVQIVRTFIDSIHASDPQPTFYYLHTLVMHFPHRFLPTGQRNGTRVAIPGEVRMNWARDEWAVTQHHQRHLLQLGFVDNVIGQLVNRLKSQGLYDRALVVLSSDHGIAYQPGEPRRGFTDQIAAEIMRVPLILKLPAGMEWPDVSGRGDASISDRNVEVIDIAPTIADVLGYELSWKTDGVSLLDESAPERSSKRMLFASGKQARSYGKDWPDPRPSIQRKIARFGGAENRYRIAKPARFTDLVGRNTADLPVTNSGVRLELLNSGAFANVRPQGPEVPFDVGGVLKGSEKRVQSYAAVAVNGVIRAVTMTWATQPDRFLATPPLDAWQPGRNRVEVFGVTGDDRHPRLLRLVPEPAHR
jgi:hypothetical protein